jgi:hypothetical protein
MGGGGVVGEARVDAEGLDFRERTLAVFLDLGGDVLWDVLVLGRTPGLDDGERCFGAL